MHDLELQEIYIYPIKSLAGTSLQRSDVQSRGLEHDRRWMITDREGNFRTQRKHPQMALLQVHVQDEGLLVAHKEDLLQPLLIPFTDTGKTVKVSIWDDICEAVTVSAIADEWFSYALKTPVQLVYMPHTSERPADENYAMNKEIVSFADSFPFLLIGQSSLDDLNQRLTSPVTMNRFRPNLVFNGGTPYFEDTLQTFRISNIPFTVVKPCGRCAIITIDQETADKGLEPMKTLAAYRTIKNKVIFGQHLVATGTGTIRVGDKLTVK